MGNPHIIRQEMRQAVAAGLDFWAFVGYPLDGPNARALHLYLASDAPGPQFCFFQELGYWGSARQPSGLADQQAELLAHPKHVRLRDGRPPFFLGWISDELVARQWGGIDGLRQYMDRFRDKVRRRIGKPPCIIIAGRPEHAARWDQALGGDGLGAYALADPGAEAPYADLTRYVATQWRAYEATGRPFVPLAMAGWDRRPRVQNPVPWEKHQKPGVGLHRHYETASPAEFGRHLRDAMAIAATQALQLVLIYAWNENDEGGFLIPTLGCRHPLLDATASVLAADHPAPTGLCDR